MEQKQTSDQLSWQEQRQEAIRRQQQRWQQLHPGHHQQAEQQAVAHAESRPQPQPQQPVYPDIPNTQSRSDALPHYPDIPPPSAPPLEPGPDWAAAEAAAAAAAEAAAAEAEQLRRQQQEEEDHRLALQLQQQFAAEDSAPGSPVGDDVIDDVPINLGFGSSDEEDWEQIARSASMARMAGGVGDPAGPAAAAARAQGRPEARASTQAAAAAGSAAGSVVGAGLSALLAMAAQAAASGARNSGPHSPSPAAAGHAADRARAEGSSNATTAGGAAGSSSGAADSGGGGSGVLGAAANALRSFLASRAAGQEGSSSAAAGVEQHSEAEAVRRWEDEQPDDQDLAMLQHVMQQLMGGTLPPGIPRTGGSSSSGPSTAAAHAADTGTSGASGFHFTRLPGGFTATYTSSGPGRGGVHMQASSHSSGATAAASDMDPMFADPGDLLSQLLLAGARSAHSSRQRPRGPGHAGFTHYDPTSGTAEFEPLGPGLGGPGALDLEGLLSAIMGPGLFSEGGMGMGYEDLVGLDPVHVTTPDDVRSSLPRSKYVEGRRPGDSDTCVICQTGYAGGDDLTHLPCLHAFHTECITPWLQDHSRKCPVCKTDVC